MNTGGGCRSILEEGGGGGNQRHTDHMVRQHEWDSTVHQPTWDRPQALQAQAVATSESPKNKSVFVHFTDATTAHTRGMWSNSTGVFFFFLASNRRLRRASPRAGQKNKSTSVNLMDTTVEIYILTFAYFLKCVLENRLTDLLFFLPYTGRRSWVRVPRHNYFLPAPF